MNNCGNEIVETMDIYKGIKNDRKVGVFAGSLLFTLPPSILFK